MYTAKIIQDKTMESSAAEAIKAGAGRGSRSGQVALLHAIFLAATYLCVACHGHADAPWQYLPPGYTYPSIGLIEPRPGAYARFGGLRIAETNKLFHFIQLDRSPLRWAGNTLRISVGFQTQWTLNDFYALFPAGYSEGKNKAVAFVASSKIDFSQAFIEGQREIRSLNHPSYTLHRRGEHLVLQKSDERRWYFESPDGGGRWRLAKMELIKHPGQFTKLNYEDNLVTRIEFPNGHAATIEYDANSLPIRITTPFGEQADIVRGDGGYVTQVTVQPTTDGNQRARKEHRKVYRYQSNGLGRIVRFVNDRGHAYEVAYESTQDGSNSKAKDTVHRITLTHIATQSRFIREHLEKDSGE